MFLDVLIMGLACWRIASMVVNEDGPWFVFDNMRRLVRAGDYNDYPPPDRRWYIGIFECIWCCSMWVGIGFAVVYWFSPSLAVLVSVPFAISAWAVVINTVLERLQN